jgi:ABC-type bacteriocin/lantibiotic exporter with double-glycine peptidase domain
MFALAMPMFSMNVYDRVVPNNAVETLWVLAIGIGLVLLFNFALSTLRSYVVDTASKRVDVSCPRRSWSGCWTCAWKRARIRGLVCVQPALV